MACNEVLVPQVVVPAAGHSIEILEGKDATCTETGLKAGAKCSVCNEILVEQEVIPAKDHEMSWNFDAETKTHTHECANCDYATEAEACIFSEVPGTEEGLVRYVCDICKGEYTEEIIEEDTVVRIAGLNRYETSFKTADELKAVMGVEKFETVIIASGADFADALSGSYLAAVKSAPILLASGTAENTAQLVEYIKANMDEGKKIYILGGTGAVPASVEDALKGMYDVERLGGENRYITNLLILKEAGVSAGEDILVSSGTGYADSLSASATGKAILLVAASISVEQAAYLNELKAEQDNDYVIVGGTGAVSATVESQLKAYGDVSRLGGATRLETSVMVAEKYFGTTENAVLVYAHNYPDGLCGGILALKLGGPLILTAGIEAAGPAAAYTVDRDVNSGYILGGPTLVTDEAARLIFAMAEEALIIER